MSRWITARSRTIYARREERPRLKLRLRTGLHGWTTARRNSCSDGGRVSTSSASSKRRGPIAESNRTRVRCGIPAEVLRAGLPLEYPADRHSLQTRKAIPRMTHSKLTAQNQLDK